MSDVMTAVEAHLRAALPGEPQRASITFLGVQAMDVLRFGPAADALVRYATVGCSRHPMVDPTQMVADPVAGPRAELIVTVRGGLDGVLRPLAVLAAAPSVEGLVLRPDALLDLGEPLWPGAAFTAVLLSSAQDEVADLPLPEPREPVRFLYAVPITQTEAAWVRLKGAAAVREAWAEAGIDVHDPLRGAATL